jgi:hypothetical protein
MPTDLDLQDANDLVAAAVAARREAQAAGKPHEEWYAVSQPVTKPMPEVAAAEEMEHVTLGYDAETMKAARDWCAARDEFAKFQSTPEHPGSLPFLELVEELRQLHLRKSQDYGTRSDPLANVRNAADLIGIEPWRAGLVRVAEKVQRIRAFCHNGHLANEGVLDSLMDLAAYSLIVAVLFKEANQSASA